MYFQILEDFKIKNCIARFCMILLYEKLLKREVGVLGK